ncbi:hypothetical protein Tcan_01101, partial [Toxocara canis]
MRLSSVIVLSIAAVFVSFTERVISKTIVHKETEAKGVVYGEEQQSYRPYNKQALEMWFMVPKNLHQEQSKAERIVLYSMLAIESAALIAMLILFALAYFKIIFRFTGPDDGIGL